jgi:hypothetical protein
MADGRADRASDLGQQLVADRVAAGVVDPLELVDVDQHERERGAVAPGALDHARDSLLERAVVAEPGQAVAQRRLARALVQLAQARSRGLELGGGPEDLAGHPGREHDQEQQHRAEGTQRLDGHRDERDRRRHDDLPAVDPG